MSVELRDDGGCIQSRLRQVRRAFWNGSSFFCCSESNNPNTQFNRQSVSTLPVLVGSPVPSF
jgi:hypothetical protein